jgi:hypothetical protein
MIIVIITITITKSGNRLEVIKQNINIYKDTMRNVNVMVIIKSNYRSA